MRVMLDTNVIISVILFNNYEWNKMIESISNNHRLVLSSYVVNELKSVIDRKFPAKMKDIEDFLVALPFELVYTPDICEKGLFEIRDEKDYPVLYTAIIEEVDIFITGDKDFHEIEVDKPEILTPATFIKKHKR